MKLIKFLFITGVLCLSISRAQVSYTFIPCGASGSVGPTAGMTGSTYLTTNLNGSVSVSAGIQSFTIPVTSAYRITAYGAKGFGTNAGRGAVIAGDFTLTAGTVLYILPGQQGAPPISPGTNQYGGGGGSFVTYTNNTPLIVAGGGGGPSALPGLAGVGLAIVGSTHLAFRAGTVMLTGEMLIAAAIALFSSIVYRFSSAERRGDLFREAISLFVGKRVAASLDDTRTIGLTGKRETVTILFTDIRGFTAYAEQVCDTDGPEVLVQKLNAYMATMAAIVVNFGGQVNKYIGDGILAVFSDEDDGAQPGDHPIRAVQCATRMVLVPGEFQTGAGLHTGLAVVGNVGSADKMEYTVLGDTVNLASRLESLNKEHKTKLLMSDATQQALNGAIETTHLGTVAVRGKAVPIQLYTVTALLESPKEVSHA